LVVENSLYHLQVLFGQLQETVKQFYIPTAFVGSIKGYDGQQINVLLQ
jgi:ubiquitin carboxyl-terminal hydrolase 9/24/ubiquitin carboxyl-terminal hydrolase 34